MAHFVAVRWTATKPGYTLQFLTNRSAVCSGISASIPCAAARRLGKQAWGIAFGNSPAYNHAA
jgi:hypothetical protein